MSLVEDAFGKFCQTGSYDRFVHVDINMQPIHEITIFRGYVRIEDDNVIPEKGIAREQSIHPRLPGSQLNDDMVGNGKSRPR
jgi:hypothetical protein